jgi:hypothetical protein
VYAIALSLLIILAQGLTGCAYSFGLSHRSLPGGYTQLDIPVFKNKTQEVGIEPLFTNALIRRFERSQAAQVTDKNAAPITLEGVINLVTYTQVSVTDDSKLTYLPQKTVLATAYQVTVSAVLLLRRKSDERVIWQGTFNEDKVYQAPQIGTALVNSADSTYNQSARMHTIGLMAEDMMAEAHDRITENY